MNTQKIVIIVGIIILLIIGWWSFGNNAEAPTDEINETSDEQTTTNTATNRNGNTNTDTNGVTSDPNAIAPVPTGNNTSADTADETVTDTAPTSEVIVRYTNIGFTPESIRVAEGTTVTFVNESTSGMWVASDNHPSHTILPAFDQKAAVSMGGTYSFTFDTVGSWGFHNHLRPEHDGIVLIYAQ
ncbi:MAG: hypothetical protein COV34_02885 [Candidatus Zambryskibacteria bacterium CG10_big_fil_rev_8_21_14_0_10_42_12]|uniref:Blue (type 1) copper domain-containing protein n=1 Tax=Candidatus Zambryskibacteria bacterium CG10_big_fil_rev_8_21_14_0_10_42_12 TaxID=1975115 RepID=A0A2H0QUP7_9BACT|nr:MAG: hypothetical protein COV34_02885 [Candidatus Zambryskibacteria bacterium CG10_big_fil_rev_8_21_14_0_10_42_12]